LLWLGTSVVFADINKNSGKLAEKILSDEFGVSRVKFFRADVGYRASVQRLTREINTHFKQVKILINNAIIAPLGKVVDTPITV
jgi:NAD(P)-dependent dehydrogenase (short-subunit alcohol dehydrogenase family)